MAFARSLPVVLLTTTTLLLDEVKVSAIFIQMCSEGMAECVAGETMLPAKFVFFGSNELVDGKRSHRAVRMITVGKEEAVRPAVLEPVLCQDIQCIFGKNGKTVGAVLGRSDMDAHGGTADVFITELGDACIDRPVGKIAFPLKPADKIT